jgi:hypothetical protein
MFEKLKDWLLERFSDDDDSLPEPLRRTGTYVAPNPKERVAKKSTVTLASNYNKLAPSIEEAGPGKNVLIRNKYVREDTGTHETLRILDDSLVDSGEETGIDPYNTGGFDRSKNWSNRFRK